MPKKTLPLTEIEVQDLQSVEHVTIKLGRMTALTGPSDVGKTAIYRAVDAWITQGNLRRLTRTGTRSCSVALRRNRTRILYDGIYTQEGGDEVEYTAQEAREKLGLLVIQLDKDLSLTPNLKAPLEPPFLVTEHPPIAAKVLSSLGQADVLLLAAGREAQRLSSGLFKDRAGLERQQEELQEVLGGLEGAPDVHMDTKDLEQDLEELELLENQRDDLRTGLESFGSRYEAAKTATTRLTALEAVGTPELPQSLWAEVEQVSSLELVLRGYELSHTKQGTAEQEVERERKNLEHLLNKRTDAVAPGAPCPFTRHPLPKACSTVLEKETE